jgi:hypothetical protein
MDDEEDGEMESEEGGRGEMSPNSILTYLLI